MSGFSKRLSLAMSERQVRQTDLAAAIGKGKSSVSQYLSGRSVPKADVQAKIAEFLDCTVEWLNSDDPETESIDIGVRRVSVTQCAKLLGMSEQCVRNGLIQRTAPYGYAVRGKTRYSYHISPKLLEEYIGSLTI